MDKVEKIWNGEKREYSDEDLSEVRRLCMEDARINGVKKDKEWNHITGKTKCPLCNGMRFYRLSGSRSLETYCLISDNFNHDCLHVYFD